MMKAVFKAGEISQHNPPPVRPEDTEARPLHDQSGVPTADSDAVIVHLKQPGNAPAEEPESSRDEEMLATLSPSLVRKFNQLLDLVLEDRERLRRFIKGVSHTNKTV